MTQLVNFTASFTKSLEREQLAAQHKDSNPKFKPTSSKHGETFTFLQTTNHSNINSTQAT